MDCSPRWQRSAKIGRFWRYARAECRVTAGAITGLARRWDVDKPRNAEEQAFWDAAFIALVAANEGVDERFAHSFDALPRIADKMLNERRKRTEQQ